MDRGEYKQLSYVRQYYNGKATESAADPVSVSAGGTSSGIDAAMVPGAEVEGMVTGGVSPMEDVEVCAYQATSGKEVGCDYTDEEGKYLIVGIPDGNYKFRFLPPSGSIYAPQYYDGKASFAAADAVPLAASAKTTGIDATLVEAGKIAGTVTNAVGGGAIQGVLVCAYSSEGSWRCASTNPAGEYTIVGLLAGEYTVRFDGGSEYLSQYFAGVTNVAEATRLTVEDGVTKAGIDAHLSPAGRIKGHVTGGDTAKSISNVEVCAVKTSAYSYFPEGTCTWTDGEGNYTLGGLGTGSYDVRFTAGYGEISPGNYGPLNYLVQYYKGAETRSQSDPVSVTAGSATSGIDATLQVGGQITGTVTEAVTHKGMEFSVCALPSLTRGGSERCAVSSGTDGTYTITRLRTDHYKVRFTSYASTMGYVRQFYNGKATKKEADPVAVTAGAAPVGGVDAVMHKGGAITGTVTDAGTHLPLEGIEVCAGGYLSCDETGADGSYELAGLASGSYRVRFSGGEGAPNYVSVYYHDKTGWEEAQKVTVVAGSTTGGINQEMHEGGRIAGTVVDDTTEDPLESIGVCAIDPDTYAYRCAQTDELGKYELVGLPPGSYRVRFTHQGWSQSPNAVYAPQYYDDAATAAEATQVAVSSGSSVSGIDAAMHKGGRIEGSVTAASNHHPVSGVQVCAFAEGEGSEEGPENCSFTDSHGEYGVDGLNAGTYEVSFYPGMYSFEPTNLLSQYYDGSSTLGGADPVSVTAGSTTSGIDAELFVGGQISGTVTDAADGSQLEGVEACAYEAGGEEEAVRCSASNAHGGYTIMPLPAGTYKVGFSAVTYDWEGFYEEEEGAEPEPEEEFLPQYWKGASSLGAASTIALSLGQSVNGIDAQMVKPSATPPSEPPPAEEGGGSSPGGGPSSGGGASQSEPPPASPPQVAPPGTPAPPSPKAVHCRKGLKKKRVHGKVRCVKPHKQKAKKHTSH